MVTNIGDHIQYEHKIIMIKDIEVWNIEYSPESCWLFTGEFK
jgi:hypothetical protein